QKDIARNAAMLQRMFETRRFAVEIVPTSGSPVLLAERRTAAARRTLTFYFHYDGQPVDPAEWVYNPPFSPVIVVPHEPAGWTVRGMRAIGRPCFSARAASWPRWSPSMVRCAICTAGTTGTGRRIRRWRWRGCWRR